MAAPAPCAAAKKGWGDECVLVLFEGVPVYKVDFHKDPKMVTTTYTNDKEAKKVYEQDMHLFCTVPCECGREDCRKRFHVATIFPKRKLVKFQGKDARCTYELKAHLHMCTYCKMVFVNRKDSPAKKIIDSGKCGKCRRAYYCCKKCQCADWKRHKHEECM